MPGIVIPTGFSQIVVQFIGPSAVGSQPTVVLAFDAPCDQNLADAFNGWVTGHLVHQLISSHEVRQTIVQDAEAQIITPIGIIGLRELQCAAPQVSCLVKKGTGGRGRRQRGRSYWPGLLADNEVDNSGLITSGIQTTTQALMDDLTTAMAAASPEAHQVILHSDPAFSPSDVTSYKVESQVANQRRRNRK